MLVWGHGRQLHTLGPLENTDSCPACRQPSTLHLAVLRKDFKLYFIPVARWNSAYYVYCGVCNASAEIDKADQGFKWEAKRFLSGQTDGSTWENVHTFGRRGGGINIAYLFHYESGAQALDGSNVV
jgi:hypothetical protein